MSTWSGRMNLMHFGYIAVNADVLLKGTNMDGGYDCHSRTNSVAFEHISYKELEARGFSAMDMTAMSFCAANNIPG